MPIYQASPIQRAVQQAVPGFPAYLLGSFNSNVPATKMSISTVALASPTATVVGVVVEGNAPTVGQLVSLQGAVPSYFNVTNAKITAVTQINTPDDGTYQIQFALTNSNIGTTASPGRAVAPQVEIGDSLTLGSPSGGNWNSAALAIQKNTGPNEGRSVRFDVSFPTLPNGGVKIVAQSADLDIDTEYVDLGTVASVTAGSLDGNTSSGNAAAVIFANTLQRFVRFQVRSIIGPGSGTVVGKVTV